MNKLWTVAAALWLCAGLGFAQKPLVLEEVLSGKLIQTKGIGAMNWLKDGERYSRLEPNASTGGINSVNVYLEVL